MKKWKAKKILSIAAPLFSAGALAAVPTLTIPFSTSNNTITIQQDKTVARQQQEAFSLTTKEAASQEQEEILDNYHVAQIPSVANNYEYFPSNNLYFESTDWNSGSYQRYELPNQNKDVWWANKGFFEIFPDPSPFRTRIFNIITGENYTDDTAVHDIVINSDAINVQLAKTDGSQYARNGKLDLSGIQMTNYQFDLLKFFQLDKCFELDISRNRLNFLPENLFSYLRYNPDGHINDPGFIAKYALQIGFPNIEVLLCNGNKPYEDYGQTISDHFFETKLIGQRDYFTASWFTYSNTRIRKLEFSNSGLSDAWCYSLLKYPGNTFTTLKEVNISKNYKITNNKVYPGFTGPLLTNFLYQWTTSYQLSESRNFFAADCSIESIDVDDLESISYPSLLRSPFASTYATPDFFYFDVSFNNLKRLNVNNSNFIGQVPMSYVKSLRAVANHLEYVSDFLNFNSSLSNEGKHTFTKNEIIDFDFTDNVINNQTLTFVLKEKEGGIGSQNKKYKLEFPIDMFPSFLFKSAGFNHPKTNKDKIIWQSIIEERAENYWLAYLKTDNKPYNISKKIKDAFRLTLKDKKKFVELDLNEEIGQNVQEFLKVREISFSNKYTGIIFNFSVRVRREVDTGNSSTNYSHVYYDRNIQLSDTNPDAGLSLHRLIEEYPTENSVIEKLIEKKPSELINKDLDVNPEDNSSSLLYRILSPEIRDHIIIPVNSKKTDVTGSPAPVVSVVPGRTILNDEYGAIRLRLQINNGIDIYGNRQTFDIMSPWIYGFKCSDTKITYNDPLTILEKLQIINSFNRANPNVNEMLKDYFLNVVWPNVLQPMNDIYTPDMVTHNNYETSIYATNMRSENFISLFQSSEFISKAESKNVIYNSFSPIFISSSAVSEEDEIIPFVQLPYVDLVFVDNNGTEQFSWVSTVLDTLPSSFWVDTSKPQLLTSPDNSNVLPKWDSVSFSNFITKVLNASGGIFPSFKNFKFRFNFSYLYGSSTSKVPRENYKIPFAIKSDSPNPKSYNAWTIPPMRDGVLSFANKDGKSIFGYEKSFLASANPDIPPEQWPVNELSLAQLDNPTSPLNFLSGSDNDLTQLRNNLENAFVKHNNENKKLKDFKPSEVTPLMLHQNLKYFLSDYSKTNTNPFASKNILPSRIRVENIKTNDFLGSIGFDVSYKNWSGFNQNDSSPNKSYNLQNTAQIPNLSYASILRQQETIIAFNSARKIKLKYKKLMDFYNDRNNVELVDQFKKIFFDIYYQPIKQILEIFDKEAKDFTPQDASILSKIFNDDFILTEKLINDVDLKINENPSNSRWTVFWTRIKNEASYLLLKCLFSEQYSIRFDFQKIEKNSFRVNLIDNQLKISFIYNYFFPSSGAPSKKKIIFSSPILKSNINLFTTPDDLNSNINSIFLYLKPLEKLYEASKTTFGQLKEGIIEHINEIVRIPNIRVDDPYFWTEFKKINNESLKQLFFTNENGDRIEFETEIAENSNFTIVIPSLITDLSNINEKSTFESDIINSNFFMTKYVPNTVWIVSIVLIVLSLVIIALWIWFLISNYRNNVKESSKIIKYFQDKKIQKQKRLSNSERLLNHPVTSSNGQLRDIVESFDSFLKIDLESSFKPKKDSEEF